MFRSYLVAATRNIVKNRLYAVINVLGLAIGLASCMLIILLVRHETSYDDFLPNLDRLYRLEAMARIPGRDEVATPSYVGPTKDLLPPDYPEVEEVLRIQQRGGAIVRDGDSFSQVLDYVDDNFFRVFELPLIEGNPATALNQPSSIVLNEEMARKYLGDGPYLGREIVVNDNYERTHVVSGIMRDIPDNSHLNLGILVPIDRKVYESTNFGGASDLDRWNGLPFFVYIKLREGTSIEPMRNTISAWVDRHFPAAISRLVNISGSELWTPRLISVRDIHLFSPAQGGMKPRGSVSTLLSFGAIALMILLIACINFMNLATARATLRGREVAIRKVMGANRKQLFTQFEAESLVFSIIAVLLAGAITELILPYFNDYTNLQVPFSLIIDPLTFSNVLALTLFVGLGAGLHPALVLSSTRPSRVLMSNQSAAPQSTRLRSILVLFQYTISAVLIMATVIIYSQNEFAQNRDLGFAKENVIIVRGLGDPQVAPSQETFRQRVAGIPGVTGAALADFGPGDGLGSGLSLHVPGEADRLVVFAHAVDWNFFSMYGIAPVAGRLFSQRFPNDIINDTPDAEGNLSPQKAGIVINESAVRRLGYASPQEALGQSVYRGRSDELEMTVVGVVPDVYFSSPRQELNPELYTLTPRNYFSLNVRVGGTDPERVGEDIDAIWKEMFPGIPANRDFLDENLAAQFEFESVLGQLMAIFSGLAILVASMGLFGLSSFTAVRRTKEIGIRKILGASSQDIIRLLLGQLSLPVIIANVIAWPIVWYAMTEWLSEFEYRIELPVYFAATAAISILATLAIAWATVAGHALRVARANPVHALRYE